MTTPDEARSPATERPLRDRVADDYESGIPAEALMRHYHLTKGELEDLLGESIEEPDYTGRSGMTGY